MAKLIKLKALTPEELAAKIATLKTNIEKLNNAGMEDMASEFQSELDVLMEAQQAAAGVNRQEEYNKLFVGLRAYILSGEDLLDLTDEQIAFIGEGLTLKLMKDGTLEFVKKNGAGGNGGSKSPTPYLEYQIPYDTAEGVKYEVFTVAAHAAGLVAEGETVNEHSVLAKLKANGVVIKLAVGDSMRREIVKLNKKYKLGVHVRLRADSGEFKANQVIDLLQSPFETEAKETGEVEGEDKE
jgi:hypothetical protein